MVKRWATRSAGVLVALLVAASLSACSSSTPKIVEIHGDPDSTELEITVDTCNQDPRVTVEESAEEVRLTISADSGGEGDDCLDSVKATLDATLGDRILVDDSTNDELRVLPSNG